MPPDEEQIQDIQVVDETLACIPNWWDTPAKPLVRPVTSVDHLASAADRLALASAAQTRAGGDLGIASKLERWCMDLKGRPTLPLVLAVLHGLDRLDREACEPQTWLHLQEAEKAVAAYVASMRQVTADRPLAVNRRAPS